MILIFMITLNANMACHIPNTIPNNITTISQLESGGKQNERINKKLTEFTKEIESYRNELEVIMLGLDADVPEICLKYYLSGVIDGWLGSGKLSEAIRDILVIEYGP